MQTVVQIALVAILGTLVPFYLMSARHPRMKHEGRGGKPWVSVARYWIHRGLAVVFLVVGFVAWWQYAIEGIPGLVTGPGQRPSLIMLARDALVAIACAGLGFDLLRSADQEDEARQSELGK